MTFFFLMWAIFKVFIDFVKNIAFNVLVFWLQGMWKFSSLTRDWTHSSCIGRQSLNHWTSMEVLTFLIFNKLPLLSSSSLSSSQIRSQSQQRGKMTSPAAGIVSECTGEVLSDDSKDPWAGYWSSDALQLIVQEITQFSLMCVQLSHWKRRQISQNTISCALYLFYAFNFLIIRTFSCHTWWMPTSATLYLIFLKGKAHLCARVSETRILNACVWKAKLTFVSLARRTSLIIYQPMMGQLGPPTGFSGI